MNRVTQLGLTAAGSLLWGLGIGMVWGVNVRADGIDLAQQRVEAIQAQADGVAQRMQVTVERLNACLDERDAAEAMRLNGVKQ